MYSIHDCPEGQMPASAGLLLHLQENRSHLSQEARVTFTALIGLFMAVAILPAIKGELLVPVFALGTMTLLVGALEWHKRSRPAAECIAILHGSLRWTSCDAMPVELPRRDTRLVREEISSARLRLFLECRHQRIEIGRCLSLDEKRAIAPLIARQLGEAEA